MNRQTFIVDASFDFDTNITGIGIVIHESDKPKKSKNGRIIDEISESYVCINAGDGELLAIYRAIEIAKERGYKNIRTKSDYNHLRKSLKKNYNEHREDNILGLFGETIRLSRIFENVDFGYKPRRKNQMAHNLARMARKEIKPMLREDIVLMTNKN